MEGTPEAKNRLTIIDGTVRKLANASHVGRGDTIASVEGRYIHGGKDFQIDDIDLLIGELVVCYLTNHKADQHFFQDCTGRAQCGVKWLEEAGFTPPQRVSYSPHLRYTTITFTGISEEVYTSLPIPAERRGGALVFYPDPNISRSGIVFSKVDGDAGTFFRVVVVLDIAEMAVQISSELVPQFLGFQQLPQAGRGRYSVSS